MEHDAGVEHVQGLHRSMAYVNLTEFNTIRLID